jgi:hypothetical protein
VPEHPGGPQGLGIGTRSEARSVRRGCGVLPPGGCVPVGTGSSKALVLTAQRTSTVPHLAGPAELRRGTERSADLPEGGPLPRAIG